MKAGFWCFTLFLSVSPVIPSLRPSGSTGVSVSLLSVCTNAHLQRQVPKVRRLSYCGFFFTFYSQLLYVFGKTLFLC